ncbi:hypothetical protein YC2023_082162 [Brassica napus]
MHELKPAEVRVDELDELSELSDTILELNELNDTEDGDGLVAGRNGPFSAQRKIHNKFNLARSKLLYFIGLVRHIKQRIETLLLLDLCVISSNN